MDLRRALHIAALRAALEDGTVKGGMIVASNDDDVCASCRELHGVRLSLAQMKAMVAGEEPLQPYDVCESEDRCRCRICFVEPLSRDFFG